MFPSKIDGNLKITGDLTAQQFILNSQFSTLEHEADLQHQLRATLEKKGPVITLSELALKTKKGEFSAKRTL